MREKCFLHLSVAAEIKEKQNSVGLGVFSAAKTMNLDFVPVADESYDLVMTKSFYESEGGQLLLEVIKSEAFKMNIEHQGGYKVVENIAPQLFNVKK
ncbi:hypothetical protein KHA80_15515 [Anaerobacillus sp. HL2]|nr:hypothetical protein KHA80_15515 [Anaerobacillus sp. HL2]